MYCIIVKNVIKPECKTDYLAVMLENANASVANETGCHTFDVIEALEEDDTFYLYEIYEDKQALAIHKQMPHYLASRPLLANIVTEVAVIRANVLGCNHRLGE